MSLLRCFSGALPFRGTLDDFLVWVRQPSTPNVAALCPRLSPDVVWLVQRMIAKDRTRRFPNLEALWARIEEILRARGFESRAHSC